MNNQFSSILFYVIISFFIFGFAKKTLNMFVNSKQNSVLDEAKSEFSEILEQQKNKTLKTQADLAAILKEKEKGHINNYRAKGVYDNAIKKHSKMVCNHINKSFNNKLHNIEKASCNGAVHYSTKSTSS